MAGFDTAVSVGKGLFDGIMGMTNFNYSIEQQKLANAINIWQTKATNEANLNLAREQNAWNYRMWEEQNKYNDPARQVSRLRDAGLSAAAAAQAIEGAGNASPLQSANLANQQIGPPYQPVIPPTLELPNFIGMLREVEALRSQKMENEKTEKTMDSSIEGILTENDAKQVGLRLQMQQFDFLSQSNPYSLRSIMAKAHSDELLPKIQQFTLKAAKINYLQAKKDYEWTDRFNQRKLDLLGAQIRETIERAEKERQEKFTSQSQEQLNDVSRGLVGAEISKTNQETKNLKEGWKGLVLENYGKVVDNTLKKYGTPDNAAERMGALVTDGVLPVDKVTNYIWAAHNYIKTQGRVYSGDNDMRNIFIHELHPGAGKPGNFGFYQYGFPQSFADLIKQAGMRFSNKDKLPASYDPQER